MIHNHSTTVHGSQALPQKSLTQCLSKIAKDGRAREQWSGLYLKGNSGIPGLVIIPNNRLLKRGVLPKLVDCNNARRCHAKDKYSRSLVYACLVLRYRTRSEKRLGGRKSRVMYPAAGY